MKSTLTYLALPYFIYFIGWLKWFLAVPLSTFLFLCIYRCFRDDKKKGKVTIDINIWRLFGIFTLIFIWLWFSGVGQYSFHNSDYQKHMGLFTDLVLIEWPVAYFIEGYIDGLINLVYYFAYYLPPAVIGKLWGLSAALHASFVWTFIGVLLSVAWVFRFVGRISIKLLVLFLLFSGLDFIGQLIASKDGIPVGTSHIEFWASFWQFSGITTLMYWTPQHALGGWLTTSLVLNEIFAGKNHRQLFFMCLATLWSPFVALGLVTICAYGVCKNNWKKSITKVNIMGGLVLGLPVTLMFLAKFPDKYSDFMLSINKPADLYPLLLLFLSLEVGVYLILIKNRYKYGEDIFSSVFWVAIYSMPLFLFYRFGIYNDMAMRGTVPLIFILFLGVAGYLFDKEKLNTGTHQLLLVTVLIGFVNSTFEINRAIIKYGTFFRSVTILSVEPKFVNQYLAVRDSFFFNYLAKHPFPQKINAPDKLKKELEKIQAIK